MAVARQMVLGVCGLLFSAAVASADNSRYTERMQFADGLHSRGMHELALKEYEALLRDFPAVKENDAACFRLAESLRHLARTVEAARAYDKLFVEYPASAYRLRAAYRRARLYVEAGNHEAATEHFKAILAENPPESIGSACFYYLGESLLALDRPGEAEAAFGVVVKRHAASMFQPYALMKQGEIQRAAWQRMLATDPVEATNRAARAVEAYEQVLKRPGTPRIAAEALFQTAEIHFRLRDYERSSACYRRLLHEYPRDERSAEARLQAAWAACNAGLYAESLALADGALKETALTNRPEWQYLKANCERQLLYHDRAIVTYGDLLTRYPESRFAAAARYELALSYYRLERYADAVREAERIPADSDMRGDVEWLLAESYSAMNKAEEAIQYYRMVLRRAPRSDRSRDATYRLAYHLQSRGVYGEASRFYNTLVEQFADDKLAAQALFASGVCLANSGAHGEAARDWGRVVREYPGSEFVEESLYQKAMSEIRIERPADALRTLGDLAKTYPKGRFAADIHYWRGMLFAGEERLQDAESELRTAVDLAPRDDLGREARFSLAVVQQKLGKDKEAAALFRRLLGTDMEARFAPAQLEWLAGFCERDGQPRDAIRAAQVLRKNGPADAWQQAGWVLEGRAEQAQKRDAQAEAAFRKALETKAATAYGAEAALSLANILLARDAVEEAGTLFEDAARRASSDATLGVRARALLGLGQCADRRGEPAVAARHYMSVAILFDDPELVPRSLYAASAAFGKAGQTSDAEIAAAELQERYPDSTWAERARSERPPSTSAGREPSAVVSTSNPG